MSYLRLNRLKVIKEGGLVYDEEFHNEINIIRGHNSTGKSTISNFIFFALGGEFVDWLPEASACDFVIAELEINGALITVKRNIENIQRRPMSIFIGGIDNAIASNYQGWNIYPYNKSDKTESFSQILFKALDFPEISTENQESVTINQILRLLYVDQLSSLDSLMRNEDFDSPLIRSAIGNLLLGTYNDDLLKIQIELRKKEREYKDVKKQVKAIEDVFDNSPFELDNTSIQGSINDKKSQLEKVLRALREPETISASIKKNDTKNEINKLRNELLKYKDRYNVTLNAISKAKTDILDNNEFIDVLKGKLTAIDESLNSREILGSFPIQYCPVCLEKIDDNVNGNHCKLCKKEIKEDSGKSKLLRMKLEVQMQLKESTSIIKEKEETLEKYISSIKETERELRKSQMSYDLFIHQTRSSLENKYDKLLVKKGELIGEIEFLENQLQLMSAYGEYKIQLFTLESAKSRLSESIEKYQKTQRKNASTAYSTIQKYTLELLKGDGVYEEKFQKGSKVTVNFGKNSFYLDDRNRFSASSLVMLKNCIRFSIFFASVELDYFRYPRFILCDNIEDKGMEEARSKNFQKNIASLASSDKFKDKNLQIIMTTSMIADELNVESYTVGGYYDSNSKSLDI